MDSSARHLVLLFCGLNMLTKIKKPDMPISEDVLIKSFGIFTYYKIYFWKYYWEERLKLDDGLLTNTRTFIIDTYYSTFSKVIQNANTNS